MTRPAGSFDPAITSPSFTKTRLLSSQFHRNKEASESGDPCKVMSIPTWYSLMTPLRGSATIFGLRPITCGNNRSHLWNEEQKTFFLAHASPYFKKMKVKGLFNLCSLSSDVSKGPGHLVSHGAQCSPAASSTIVNFSNISTTVMLWQAIDTKAGSPRGW